MPAKPVDPEKRLRRILNKDGGLERIDVSFSHHGVSARAVPNSFHPLVAKRRSLAFAERGGSVSIAEATEVNNNSLATPVATAFAADLDTAAQMLETKLKERVAD